MTKLIFKLDEKGWFQALGLHHAAVTILSIFLGYLLDRAIGIPSDDFMAIFCIGWFASREWGLDWKPPKKFEIMDFLTPIIVASLYLGVTE